MEQFELYNQMYGVSYEAYMKIKEAEESLQERFQHLHALKERNQLKVLKALQDNDLAQSDFYSTTGYGYGDGGREKTERIFRDVFRAEDAIVRPSLASGTHALSTILFSLLKYGDRMVSVSNDPYDTLQEVIGIRGNQVGTLLEYGVHYDSVALLEHSTFDFPAIEKALQKKTKLVLIQRSTGYTDRSALTIDKIEEAISFIRRISPDTIIMVDNCYGEFTEEREPIEVGADIMAGSLIKNPGGGIAISGGYIAGRKDLVERCMNHLTAPGLGKDTGLTFGTTRWTLQGFFLAPHVTIEAMKGALLFGKVFDNLGYHVVPTMEEKRSDIIQAIRLEDPQKVIAFCRAVQRAASVGALVVPYPWDMPGYTDRVIMASGGFVDGSSIEISADGPLREPYWVYYQGGVVYEQAKLACMMAVHAILEES